MVESTTFPSIKSDERMIESTAFPSIKSDERMIESTTFPSIKSDERMVELDMLSYSRLLLKISESIIVL